MKAIFLLSALFCGLLQAQDCQHYEAKKVGGIGRYSCVDNEEVLPHVYMLYGDSYDALGIVTEDDWAHAYWNEPARLVEHPYWDRDHFVFPPRYEGSLIFTPAFWSIDRRYDNTVGFFGSDKTQLECVYPFRDAGGICQIILGFYSNLKGRWVTCKQVYGQQIQCSYPIPEPEQPYISALVEPKTIIRARFWHVNYCGFLFNVGDVEINYRRDTLAFIICEGKIYNDDDMDVHSWGGTVTKMGPIKK